MVASGSKGYADGPGASGTARQRSALQLWAAKSLHHLVAPLLRRSNAISRRYLRAAAAVPLALGGLRFFQVLELYCLARIGPRAQAAATIGVAVRWAALSLSVGLAVGGMRLLQERLAEHDHRGANAVAWLVAALVLLSGMGLGLVGLACTGYLAGWMALPPDLFLPTVAYLRMVFVGLPPMGVLLALGTLWQAVGASRLMVLLQVLATGVSLTLLPVAVSQLGIAGAALAAALGPALLAIVQIMLYGRGKGGLRLEHQTLPLAPRYAASLLAGSALPTLQVLVCTLGQVVLVVSLARFGLMVLAGYAVAHALLLLLLTPGLSLSNLGAALAVDSVQAGRPAQAAQRAWLMGALNLGYMIIVVTLVFRFAPQLIELFGQAMSLIQYGGDALRLLALGYLSSSLSVVLARGFDPIGQTVPTAWTNALSIWGVQIPIALLLGDLMGITGLWLGIAAGAVANGLLLGYRFRRGKWRPAS